MGLLTDRRKAFKESTIKSLDTMVIPTPAKSKFEFNTMQKLFANGVKEHHYFGNWSGTGVGKTYSFILASRMIDSSFTVIIGTNSTKNQLGADILDLYPDSVVKVYNGKLPEFNMSDHNYLIFNYEKGQQEYSETLFKKVIDKYKIDYIVFDEVQLIKETSVETSSTRRKLFQDFRNEAVKKYNSYISVLSATPYVNTLNEVVSILTLLTGKDYSDISTRNDLTNTIHIETLLNGNGIRATTPAKNIYGDVVTATEHILPVDATYGMFDVFKENIKENNGPLQIYHDTMLSKLEYINSHSIIKKGEFTILYTHFVSGLTRMIKQFYTSRGYRVCEYTGEIKDTEGYIKGNRIDWTSVKGDYDILLASSPIGIGVDGLQKICNKIVFLTLPWTYAFYNQIIGRLVRQGSVFNNVDIYIPLVQFEEIGNIGYDDKVWASIVNKSIFSKACLDGELPEKNGDAHKSILAELVERIDDVNTMIERDKDDRPFLITPDAFLDDCEENHKERISSALNEYNRRGRTMTSDHMHQYFTEHPEDFDDYHKLRNESMKDWGEIPYEWICSQITSTRKVIADFGCGDGAHIANILKDNKVYSFDHISKCDDVISCNMKDVSEYLNDNSIDIAVFSLSLWGDWKDCLKEAYRVLDNCGSTIYIAEPNEMRDGEYIIDVLKTIGFQNCEILRNTGKFVYFKAIKI